MKADRLPELNEHQIQAGFFREVKFAHRLDESFIPELLYAVLNGPWLASGDDDTKKNDRRKAGLIAKYMAEGWTPGIADVHYDQPRGPYNKLVFEFKKESRRRSKNGGVSEDQQKYINAVNPYAFTRVVYSVDEALEAFAEYMALPAKVHLQIVRDAIYAMGEVENMMDSIMRNPESLLKRK